MSSILTNNGAMVALQTLNSVNKNLGMTQSEISTGKSVANAKDNSAIWAISKTMESDVAGFKAIQSSLNLGESTVSVARATAEDVTDNLKAIKKEIVGMQDGTVSREDLAERVKSLAAQISSNVEAAQVNGVNLVNNSITGTSVDTTGDGTGDAAGINVISSLDRSATGVTASKIGVAAINLKTDALSGMKADGTTPMTLKDIVDLDFAASADPDADAADALSAIEGMIAQATKAGASFGSVQSRIGMQNDFVGKLSDALTSGIGSLVDANLEESSARLQALQVQQQLATQSLSIANQAPQSILSLFR